MRKLPAFFFALLVALTSIGCDSDSTDDDLTDAEIIVGDWTLVELFDQNGDRDMRPVFELIANGLTATLRSDNTFDVLVDYADQEDLTVVGTYTIDESTNRLELDTGDAIAPFTYDIESENRMTLSADAAFVNELFGAELFEGTVQIGIQKTS